jgi:ribosomal-protein-alanine N-acetyltransferase
VAGEKYIDLGEGRSDAMEIFEFRRSCNMVLSTERLFLRPWKETDAGSLYEYAKNPEVGPAAGWPPHKNIEESRDIIQNVLNGKECYAVCLKSDNRAVGAIELKLNGNTDMTDKEDECELGYWIGQEFWGQGLIPEAASELLRHGFEDLGMNIIWCGYYEGNTKSKRVQEKLGFIYHHTCNDVTVPLMGETRIGHTNYMTREQWEANR